MPLFPVFFPYFRFVIHQPRLLCITGLLGLYLGLCGCVSHAQPATDKAVDDDIPVVSLKQNMILGDLIPELADKRVVYVGEIHDRYDHHLVQLEIIRRLHALHPQLAIGMEFFQQPFQNHLDDYIAGKIDEHELLRRTQYYKRWGFDFRLYAPILRYARKHGLPLVALNIPAEITAKISRGEHDQLSPEQRALLPDSIDRSDATYTARLKETFAQHPHGSQRDFERFVEVQLLWDESMANQAARFLASHPNHHMVLLAGSGHLAYGSGIPRRLERRITVNSDIVLNDWEGDITPDLADHLLFPEPVALPENGRIGATLEPGKNGLEVVSCLPDSACEHLALKRGDQILSINGSSIVEMADLRVALWDKKPGDVVDLKIRRPRWLNDPLDQQHRVTLR